MMDDFQPRRRQQDYIPKGPLGRPDDGSDELPGFRLESVLPAEAGQNLMPEYENRGQSGPAGPYQPFVPDEEPIEEPFNVQPEELTPMPIKPKKKPAKKKILVTLLILLALGAGGFAAWWFGFRDTGPEVTDVIVTNEVVEEELEEDDGLVPSPLSGVDVSPADAARPVTAIMIENSGEARPQSGLREADVVFEAIAEGGITRFVAMYQAKQPDYIGPVRSARPYYVEWARAFDASYVHAGGSPDGMARIGQLGVKDLSAFGFNEDVFFRTSDRFAPHNLYTKFPGLDGANQQIGNTKSTFTPWVRKQDVPQAPLANKIDIVISQPFYNPSYTYDPAENNYKRSLGGEAHLDEKSGKQLAPYTVLVMVMNRSTSGIYSFYSTTGSGTFFAFQDGVMSQGTWERASMEANYVFKDKYGFEFAFNKGQAWVSIVTEPGDVTATP